MTPEEKALLEKTYKVALENNSLLKSLRRSQRIRQAISAAYWIAIIVISFGSYFVIQPYLGQLISTYTGLEDSVNTLKSASDSVGKYIPN